LKGKKMNSNNSQKFVLPVEIKAKIGERLSAWDKADVVSRVWKKDPTVWKEKKEDDKELSNRLGWLDLPKEMQKHIGELSSFADEVKKDFDHVVLLGMGGSSLAPEVLFKTFGKAEGYPDLTILDSTHPASVKNILNNYNIARTLFIVASKSGGTAETMSFYYTFYETLAKSGAEAGRNFVAVTDPGSGLEKLATDKKFRRILSTPPEVGGRYSVYTFFGLLPAALIGVDLSELLGRAEELENECSALVKAVNNTGVELGAVIGELASAGKDKLTFIASPSIAAFPVWVEQLIAESTGKEGKGILPVADEQVGEPSVYGKDRVFVYLRVNEDETASLDKKVKALEEAGNPVIYVTVRDKFDIGHEFYRWEMATALSGVVLGINPFDQPNVQLAKTLANEGIDNYLKTGKLPHDEPVIAGSEVSVFGETSAKDAADVLPEFFASAKDGNYAAVMGFIPYSSATDEALDELRTKIRAKCKIAVTTGYGPRFLHSTGQLHKGDGNKGLFIQFTSSTSDDLEVPGKGYSFGTLISAQAQGDLKALKNTGRKTIRFHFEGDVAEGIKKISSKL
jgi:glucose-6-phosphate isomerase